MDVIVITLISFLLLRFLSFLIPDFSVITPDGTGITNKFTDVFMRIDNSSNDAETNQMIYLVDISDLSSRSEIARTLDTIYSMDPAVIGVDLFFPRLSNNRTEDSILYNIANKIADKTVFVSELDQYLSKEDKFSTINHSYFCTDNIQEGYANVQNNMDSSPVSYFKVSENYMDQPVLSFPSKMLQIANPEAFDIDLNLEQPIKYSDTTFKILYPSDLAAEDISGSFIIVGSKNNQNDLLNTPIGIMSGMEVHAYTLKTMLQDNPIQKISTFWEYVFCIFVSWLLSVMLVYSDVLIDRFAPISKTFISQSSLLTQLFSALWVVGIMFLCYYAYKQGTYFNGTFALMILAVTIEVKTLYAAAISSLSYKYDWKIFDYSFYNQHKTLSNEN